MIQRYVPPPSTKDPCEKQKVRLQAVMSGIEEVDEGNCDESPEPSAEDAEDPIDERKKVISLLFSSNIIRFLSIVLREIEERTAWLNDMIALGEGKQHKQQIMNEIAERLRLIREIEAARNAK